MTVTTVQALFPPPVDLSLPLHERVTGYVFTDIRGRTIRYLGAPPVGERWMIHPYSYRSGDAWTWDYHILSYCEPHPWYYGTAIGPRQQECASDCAYLDGCAECNSDEYFECPTGNCADPSHRPIVEFPNRDDRECACTRRCDECGDWEPVDNVDFLSSLEVLVCNCCRRRNFTECSDCGEWWRDSEGHDDCPSGYCDECERYECRCAESSPLIESYSYKPAPVFHGTGPLYLGLEVEIGGMEDRVREIAQYVSGRMGDVAYLKSDSSVSEGFEMVTHPMEYGWALENLPWGMWQTMRDTYGLRNDSSCGIHVHVSRDGFDNPSHVYRWLKFFHRNKHNIRKVARRDCGEWAKFSADARAWAIHYAKTGERATDSYSWRDGYGDSRAWWATNAKISAHGNPSYADRYSAINVQNEDTLEVRVFAGSVYRSQIQAAMGLVHASVEYTRALTARDILTRDGWAWGPFVEYITGKPEYSALASEIERLCR